ncbi:MAG: hypothetical protein QOJ25_1877 [Solirubrobacteraceae bacterium]|jgi:hypothetical protein|nr:hypothetical protein [Solirubrobacteraceae bacterium]
MAVLAGITPVLGYVGALVLLFVVLPVVVILLRGVLLAAKSIPSTIDAIAQVATAGSRDLNAVQLLYTTQPAVNQIIGVVANFGGSLDILMEDA